MQGGRAAPSGITLKALSASDHLYIRPTRPAAWSYRAVTVALNLCLEEGAAAWTTPGQAGCNERTLARVKGETTRVADRNAQKDEHLAQLMRAANRGDADAYRRVLEDLVPMLRGLARRGFARYRAGAEEVEDIVQETLLALHLKRHTWDERQPLLPWVRAIAHNKLIDNLRRRGRQQEVPIDDFAPALALDAEPAASAGLDAGRMLASLNARQRDIVRAVSIEGASAAEVGRRLGMTEGAVRVALHRALRSLAAAFRDGGRGDAREGPPGDLHEN